jgi:radical SAM superfamily enzyme YgiQ (UPF0313 family)
MRALLVYPLFPKTFWSYEKILELVNRKVLMPPLGLITVASLLPKDWEMKLVDRNIRPISEAEWQWADIVFLSAMIVQKEDFISHVRKAKLRGKKVAAGGLYPTSLPQEAIGAGTDFLILDEGGNINQTMIINFIPTRPVEEIVKEYVETFCILFEPKQYLERAYHCFMRLGTPNVSRPFKMPKWVDLSKSLFNYTLETRH